MGEMASHYMGEMVFTRYPNRREISYIESMTDLSHPSFKFSDNNFSKGKNSASLLGQQAYKMICAF